MSDNKRDILESHDKGIDQAENPLARLFRQILRDLAVHPYRWAHLMDRFLKDPRNGIPPTPKDRSSARGNLNKELRKTKITFSTLIKGIRLLNPVSVRFELHLKWHTGKTTVHGVDVMLKRSQQSDGSPIISALFDEADELLGTGELERVLTNAWLEDSTGDDDVNDVIQTDR